MRWNDSATWDDTLIWSETETLGAITETSETVVKPIFTTPKIDSMIKARVRIDMISSGDISADAELTDLFTDRIYLDKIIIIENDGHTGQLSGGTTSGGFDLFRSSGVAGSDATVISIDKVLFTPGSIFIHHAGSGDTWASMNVDIYMLYWKL